MNRSPWVGWREVAMLLAALALAVALGALGTSAVVHYRRFSKVGEGHQRLLELAEAAMTASQRERLGERTLDVCPSASKPVPSDLALVRGKTYRPTDADWKDPQDVKEDRGFPCLNYVGARDLSVQVDYRSNSSPRHRGTEFVAIVRGEVDDDGVVLTRSLRGHLSSDGRMVLEPQSRDWPLGAE